MTDAAGDRGRAAQRMLVFDADHLHVSVDRGQLVIRHGRDPVDEQRFSRAYFRHDRLVILGAHGYLTLAALRWLADVRTSFVHIDSIGRVTATSAPRQLDDARLRRHQALAPYTPLGVEIARTLITDKLRGQVATLEQLDAPAKPRAAVVSAFDKASSSQTLTELRTLEADGALAYWQAWATVAMRFVSRDKARVPRHWLVVGQRSSPLTASPRRAATPAHAMLNLMYAVLESEARIASLTIGLDPGLGILHYDQRGRASFALDLMEPARPTIDAQLHHLVCSHSFRRADFVEAPDGTCRIEPTLAREICLATQAREVLAGHAEWIAKMLAATRVEPPETFRLGAGFHVPTRLSQAHRSDARDGIRRTQRRTARIPKPRLSATCVECGCHLGDQERVRCDACHAEWNQGRLAAYQTVETNRRAQTGDHPSRRAAVRDEIGSTQRLQWKMRAQAGEVSGYGAQPSAFRRMVLPRLQGVARSKLARATGLSPGYCALIRDGKRVPHPRHWAALELAGLQASEQAR